MMPPIEMFKRAGGIAIGLGISIGMYVGFEKSAKVERDYIKTHPESVSKSHTQLSKDSDYLKPQTPDPKYSNKYFAPIFYDDETIIRVSKMPLRGMTYGIITVVGTHSREPASVTMFNLTKDSLEVELLKLQLQPLK